jgi:hemolysin activation/secretion protein
MNESQQFAAKLRNTGMTLKKLAACISLFSVSGLVSTSLLAQVVTPPNAGTFIREIESESRVQSLSQDEAISLPQPAPETAPAPAGGPAVLVDRFVVTGAQAIPAATLEALLTDLQGKALTLAELQEAAARVTRHYRDQGYFLTRAYLPQQDVSQGVITIAVLEGRLGKVDINNRSRVRDSIVKRPLKHLEPGQMLQAKDFETPLLRLNDIVGVNATTTLAPGEALGTSDLKVDVAPTKLVSGTLEFDNFGSPYTGEYRLGGSLRLNSPLGLGDRLDLRALGSDEDHRFYRAQYLVPVGRWATEIGVAYSDMNYELAEEFAAIGAIGEAQITSVFVRQSLKRTRNANLEVQLQYDSKDLEDKILAFGALSDKESELYTLTILGDLRDNFGGGGITRASLAYTAGDLTINSYLDKVIDSVTARSEGSFHRWTPSLMRLQTLGGNWSLHAQIHGQFANKNLDSSEKFSLGGSYGVRGYPQSEASGDQGWLANVELRYDINNQWQVFGLVDHGEVKRNKKPWDASDNDRTLSAAGLGARWRYKALALNGVVATPIGSEESRIDDRDPRAWVQLILSF